MNLYGILAIRPAYVLLQQNSVDVCLVNVIVAYIQLVGETVVNLFKFKVTANPIVGTMTAAISIVGPHALLLGHIYSVSVFRGTDRHHLIIPHRVVEISLSPSQCFNAAIYFRSIDFLVTDLFFGPFKLVFVSFSVATFTVIKRIVPNHILCDTLAHPEVVEIVCANP